MKPRVAKAQEGQTKIAPADKFVGQVLQDQVFEPEDPSRLRVTRVTSVSYTHLTLPTSDLV